MKTALRTHTCGELTIKDLDKEVTLSGWVQSRRDHGGVIFIDLRDRYGITQVVFNPEFCSKEVHTHANDLRREDVINVTGKVRKRAEGMDNPKLLTGEIEVYSSKIIVLNKSLTPPIEIDDNKVANEDFRLKFRYLDLRRPQMQNHLIFRHKVAMAARESMSKQGFLEIETPLLVKSTPEGARDYVVPSRVNPGKFYALPQSPQLYKQLLMVSGLDRYFQLAKCLRDEDLRADRQPEFTQIDAEMSFVEQDDVFKVGEQLISDIFEKTKGIKLKTPFLRLPYKEAMDKYGCDKPDLRFGLELHEVSNIVIKSDFGVFKDVVANKGIIKCIIPEKDLPRNDIDNYIKFCQENGAKGMAWMRVTDKGLESNIAKYFSPEVQKELLEKTKAKPGSIMMFIAGKEKLCNEILAKLRNKLGADLGLYKKDEYFFLWVVDFPLFEWDEEGSCWNAAHHMFTMPKKECLPYLESDPGKVYATCYDMVLNGVELASGSIRIHDPAIQERVMKVVGFPKEKAEARFGFLLEAFKYGAPPHGGFGIGFDRLVAMMQGFSDIREIIAFPKNKAAQCPMDGSPSDITDQQLKELHIKTNVIITEKYDLFNKIKALLDSKGIKYDVVEHKPVYTSEEAAKARGTDIKQGAKALVCITKAGKVQAIISAATELDEAKLKKVLNVDSVRLATADEVEKIAGVTVGAVPPFGNLFEVEMVVDKKLLLNEKIAFNAGAHTKSLILGSKDWLAATNAKVVDISK